MAGSINNLIIYRFERASEELENANLLLDAEDQIQNAKKFLAFIKAYLEEKHILAK